ncbi:MAG TPA: helix-turn-helix domain-containing protein [Solirubrobacteraceae bacterium]|nr:helix-turn-helix domain-containing protein [Solirubrobacteraceae bacterium]
MTGAAVASGREAGEAEATRLLTELGLTVNEARVYLALLRCFDSPTAAEAATAAGVPRPKVYEALQALEGRGFSKSVGGRVRRFIPVEPETALRGWLSHREHERAEMSERDQNRVEALGRLLPAPASGAGAQVADFIGAISGQVPTTEALDDLVSRARRTLDIMLQPPFVQPRPRWNVLEVEALERGVEVRAIYTPAGLEDPRRYQDIVRYGGRVRMLAHLPMKLMVRDRDEALISLRDIGTGAQSVTTVAVRHPDLVAPLTTLFEQQWRKARALPRDMRLRTPAARAS